MFLLQISPSRRVGRVRACPPVLDLMYPSRTRDALSIFQTHNTQSSTLQAPFVFAVAAHSVIPTDVDVSQSGAEARYSHEMSKQALGNVLAGVAFLIVAIVDFTRDSSGIGVVFLVFAAVFLGLGLSGIRRQPRSSPQGD